MTVQCSMRITKVETPNLGFRVHITPGRVVGAVKAIFAPDKPGDPAGGLREVKFSIGIVVRSGVNALQRHLTLIVE